MHQLLLATLGLLLAAPSPPALSPAQATPPIVALLDRYNAGEFDAVVGAFADIQKQVRDVAARTESALHLVALSRSQGSGRPSGTYWAPINDDPDGPDGLRDAAGVTGGQVHDRFFGSPDPVKTFDRILDDFRASYVLRYTPTGVERGGWHEIEVTVPSAPRATVRARRGYYGG